MPIWTPRYRRNVKYDAILKKLFHHPPQRLLSYALGREIDGDWLLECVDLDQEGIEKGPERGFIEGEEKMLCEIAG